MSDAFVYFFANPCFDSLQSVTLVHHNGELSIEGSRQAHIYKARELIFSESQVIATPVFRAPYSILAVMQASLLDSEPFEQRLEVMELRVCSRQRVLPSDFQSCLVYTWQARLAPDWNRVAQYLFHGRDFLVNTGVQLAVEYMILATETQTTLTLAGRTIRLPRMTMADLRKSRHDRATLQWLSAEEVPIEPLQCYVLPSMETAIAIAVAPKVCPDCPYGRFQELKKFWKDTYGYPIPEETEGTMIYVKVRFREPRERCYVYPILCVRPTEPQPLACRNPYGIISEFLQCVELKMSHVCGQKFQLVSYNSAFPTLKQRWTAKDAQVGLHSQGP
ncbi:uncharacterized protein C18orf63-like [Dermacentor silvarum]|uniref:uncharacterized protein C18orf63-like n=1 Tax=Dermacentor silvarum TaxID=543639 RepID=UPI0021008AEE|nr:uncharacterized protein C18orf63-like [Dermacentor silvarum]